MATLQEYKCPCCGGAIAFDSSLQKMKCPFCDTEFDLETLEGYDSVLKEEMPDNLNWDMNAGSEWTEGETEGIRVYSCKSCGGEIVGDANTAATSGPFCGNPVVMMNQFSGILKPDYVIPFKLDKKAAKAEEPAPQPAAAPVFKQPQQQPTFKMPAFQQPKFGEAPSSFTSTVPKKDIQIPDFLKNRK